MQFPTFDEHSATAVTSLDLEVDTDASNPIVFHGTMTPEVHGAPTNAFFADTIASDLDIISGAIESTEQDRPARRQNWRSTLVSSVLEAVNASPVVSSLPTRARGRNHNNGLGKAATKQTVGTQRIRNRRATAKSASTINKRTSKNGAEGERTQAKSGRAHQRCKKDDDALDCIYAEIQDSVGMCRYWGKKCWNMRVPKPKGGFHSLCHFHRAKANDNQRRFDFKRRGTLWREFVPDPDIEDISLFPILSADASTSCGLSTGDFDSGAFTKLMYYDPAAKLEPFTRPVALQDQDVELLQELVGSTGILDGDDRDASWS